MIFDILKAKELGFNMLRKHIKVEPMRWYYHCDRLGMLVWQDMPSGGTKQHKSVTLVFPNIGINKLKDNRYGLFSRKSENSRETFISEYTEMLELLYNCTSIAVWVPFNEAWGNSTQTESLGLQRISTLLALSTTPAVGTTKAAGI